MLSVTDFMGRPYSWNILTTGAKISGKSEKPREKPLYNLSAYVWIIGADEKWSPKERCQIMENSGTQAE